MKCTKTKNPCRICFETVTNKTGLQCKGDCKKWAHYKCLKYTPGRIRDIKKGYIIVKCHCAECKDDEPKEIMPKQPYSCCKSGCQSNQPCEKLKFPINLPLPCNTTQTGSPTPSYIELTDSSGSISPHHLPSPSKPLPRKAGHSSTSPKDKPTPLQSNKNVPRETSPCQSSKDEFPPCHKSSHNPPSSRKSADHRFNDLTNKLSASEEPSPDKLCSPKSPFLKHTYQQAKPMLNKTTSPETKCKCYSHASLMSNDMNDTNNVGDGLKQISDTNIRNANEQHAIVSAVDKMHAAVNQLATQMNELITEIKHKTNKQHK